MRIGEWVQLYKHWVPIPPRMAMAFGLQDSSQLYLARVVEEPTTARFGCEIIVSPVPPDAWPSVCRLSVRLSDRPRALAVATRFLREQRINILLTECCSTYQNRAHWDAICDIAETKWFERLQSVPRPKYEREMEKVLNALSTELADFIDIPANADAFTRGLAQHARFSPLTGLNDASFICERQNILPIMHEGGAIAIPEPLVDSVAELCKLQTGTLPYYALITGNTEQRYLRILFMHDDDQMFQLTITNRLSDFSGGGVGVLNQILEALPEQVNLMRVANYIVEKSPSVEAGRIEMIGHWQGAHADREVMRPAEMERELRERLENLTVRDLAGHPHKAALAEFVFSSPRVVNPPVFVSYSTKLEVAKLNYLLGALAANQFEPILGTDSGTTLAGAVESQPESTSANVTDAAFRLIPMCLAFISLQVKREEYRVVGDTEKYALPPWAVAEETFAWSRGVPLLLRLRDRAVDTTTYDRNILAKEFSTEEEYHVAVEEVITELKNFRRGRNFARLWAKKRDEFFRARQGLAVSQAGPQT